MVLQLESGESGEVECTRSKFVLWILPREFRAGRHRLLARGRQFRQGRSASEGQARNEWTLRMSGQGFVESGDRISCAIETHKRLSEPVGRLGCLGRFR